MKRRQLLRQGALASATGLLSVGMHGWALRSPAGAAQPADATPRLVVIFLRGAADGLNIVVPYQEPYYYEARPFLAIAPPEKDNGALDLDGQFGLHPALAPLVPHWQAGNLAFVHACGSPVVTRSHFQAQDNMETAAPGESSIRNGWLNRLIAFLPEGTPTRAVSIAGATPLIFTGEQFVTSIAAGRSGSRRLPIDNERIQSAFDQLYSGQDRLSQMYQEARMARNILSEALNGEDEGASRNAPAPGQFLGSIQHLTRLMKGDAATQVAFMELGKWDTHVNQPNPFKANLSDLAAGLDALATGLGPIYNRTAIVVMSEFGRTVRQNGNGGTDHGHGNVMWLMGGAIRGGRMYGQWPGLAPEQLHENRDLAVTTDFRDVLGSLLVQHFGLNDEAIAQVFP